MISPHKPQDKPPKEVKGSEGSKAPINPRRTRSWVESDESIWCGSWMSSLLNLTLDVTGPMERTETVDPVTERHRPSASPRATRKAPPIAKSTGTTPQATGPP